MVAGGRASFGDLGYAFELGNYVEYSGAPNEDEILQYARVVIDRATADPDGKKRALVIRGGIANFTDVAATFNGIIRALKEKLKAAQIHIYVSRGGPNYQKGLAKMRMLGGDWNPYRGVAHSLVALTAPTTSLIFPGKIIQVKLLALKMSHK